MLCKHLSQGIKRLPARFLGTAIEKKVFFLILGGKAGLRKRNRKVCYQYEQSSKFGKPNWTALQYSRVGVLHFASFDSF